MPPNLDTGWTFRKLVAEVAEAAGLANQLGAVADIPTDPHQLDLVKRKTNQGYKEFVRLDPQWSFRHRSFQLVTDPTGLSAICVGGNAGIMRLPRWLQKPPTSEFRFVDANSLYHAICPRPFAWIKSQQARYTEAAVPQYGAVRPIESGDGLDGGIAYALYVWPKPDVAYTLEADGFVFPYDMVELDERHIAGAEHDEAIKAFGIKFLHDSPSEDPAKRAASREEADRQFLISKQIDAGPRTGITGMMRDPAMTQARRRDSYDGGESETYLTVYGQPFGG